MKLFSLVDPTLLNPKRPGIFSEGPFSPSGGLMQHLEAFLVVTTWGKAEGNVLLAFGGRGAAKCG